MTPGDSLLSTYYVPGAVGDTGDRTGNKKVKERCRKQICLHNVWEVKENGQGKEPEMGPGSPPEPSRMTEGGIGPNTE